ncbi:hypothetical protein [Facklamia sp. P12950]|uniref:hypothetical protein n=1 Tax=Facklamia sp. P12950 TaxID=3421951 RepID=UPI003D162FCB
MLKGKSVIELTDVRTNKKEVYEDENLITNAVPDLLRLNPMGLMYPVGESRITEYDKEIFPIAKKCYGGILLFEDKLVEEADKIFAPSDNQIIGYASNDVNQTDAPKRGSANLTETTPLENGHKFVWDFSTSQANGRISSLALTHYRGGKYFYGDTHGKDPFILLNRTCFYNNRELSDSYNGCVEMDFKNNSLVSIWPIDEKSIELIKLKSPFTSVGLNDPINGKANYAEEKITIDVSEFFSQCYNWYETCFYDGEDGYWYGFGTKRENLVRIKIKKDDYSTKTDVWSLNGIRLPVLGSYNKKTSSYCHRYNYCCIKNGYLYVLGKYSTDKVYKININNPVDISIIELGKEVNTSRYSGEYNYLYNWGDYILGYKFVIDKNDQVIVNDVSNYDGRLPNYLMTEVKTIGPLAIGFGGYEERFYKLLYLHTPYLGTINNLSSPILKTADKTMKITYILTEEEVNE